MGVSPSVPELQAAIAEDIPGQLQYHFCLPGSSFTHGRHAVCTPTARGAALLALPQEPLVVQLVTGEGEPVACDGDACGSAAPSGGAGAQEAGSAAALAEFLSELDPVRRARACSVLTRRADGLPAPVSSACGRVAARVALLRAARAARPGARRRAVRRHRGAWLGARGPHGAAAAGRRHGGRRAARAAGAGGAVARHARAPACPAGAGGPGARAGISRA
jgi:hypothetical protein